MEGIIQRILFAIRGIVLCQDLAKIYTLCFAGCPDLEVPDTFLLQP
jgi:hypothetical protein